MIKLVAADLDGTLFNNQNEITRKSAETIRAVQQNGTEFLICTGRDYMQLNDITAAAGVVCKSICMSGAALYDEQGRRLSSVALSPELARQVRDVFRSEGLFCDIRTDEGNFAIGSRDEVEYYYRNVFYKSMEQIGKYFPQEEIDKRMQYIQILDDEQALAKRDMDIYKLSGYTMNAALLERVREGLKSVQGIAAASSFPVNLEVTAEEAQKGQAVGRYARERGIAEEEIMVIGDSENDLSMFEMNYRYRVAMDNADDIIRQRANYVTKSNEEDGVAEALLRFIL